MTKVLITGGGIGGISTALSLIKHGFEVEVYEQASELMEIGAGIQLSANAMHVLLAHGLEPQLVETTGISEESWVSKFP